MVNEQRNHIQADEMKSILTLLEFLNASDIKKDIGLGDILLTDSNGEDLGIISYYTHGSEYVFQASE